MEIYTAKEEDNSFMLSYSGEIISSDSNNINTVSSGGTLKLANVQSGGITLIRVKLFD